MAGPLHVEQQMGTYPQCEMWGALMTAVVG